MRIKLQRENVCLAGRTPRQTKSAQSPTALVEHARRDLLARGVAPDLSEMIAAQMIERRGSRNLSQEQYEALIDGAVLACGVSSENESDSEESASQVREIERMMRAFAGELGKLDENLEVLAAYVRRMRNPPPPQLPVRQDQTLH